MATNTEHHDEVQGSQDAVSSPVDISLQAAVDTPTEPSFAARYQELTTLQGALEELVAETGFPDVRNKLATVYMVSGRFQDAQSVLERCLEEKPDYFDAWANLAFTRLQMGFVPEARTILPRLLRIYTNNADLHNLYGLFLAVQGDYSEAIEEYKRALALRSPFDTVHNNLALAYEALGQQEDALLHFRKATGLELLYNRLGIVEGDEIQPEAVERLRARAEGNPLRALIFYEMATYCGTLEKKERALQILGEALVIEPDFARYYTALGSLEMNWEERQEAVEHLQLALEVDPTAYIAHIHLGFYYGEEEQMDRVLEHFQKAIDLRPYYPDLRYNMGDALLSLGRVEEAIECFQRALTLQPFYEMALFKLGYAYQEASQPEQSIETHERLKSLAPDFPDIDEFLQKAEKESKATSSRQ